MTARHTAIDRSATTGRWIRGIAGCIACMAMISLGGCVLLTQAYSPYGGYQPAYQSAYQPAYQSAYQSPYQATGQPVYQPAYPTYTTANPPVQAAPPVQATPQVIAQFDAQQLDQIDAPIALYPDPLLAELLPASTYPQQVQQAAQWLAYNPMPSQLLIDMQPWDASVKALVHYPTVLAYMNANLNWTEALGVAFLNQQADVMASIQRLRAEAIAAGTLQSTPQQQVITQNGVIWIEPANPAVLYVPQYDPSAVYVRRAGFAPGGWITFSVGFGIGAWLDNDCSWRNHWITTGAGWQRHWRRDNQGHWIRRFHQFRNNQRQFRPRPAPGRRWARDSRQPLPAVRPENLPRGALRQYRGWQPQQNQRVRRNPAAFGRAPQRQNRFQPPRQTVFGGQYRSAATVHRAANRGRQSWNQNAAKFGRQNNRRPGGNPRQFRNSRPRGRNRQQAFAIRGSGRQVRQDSHRGHQSMARKRH